MLLQQRLEEVLAARAEEQREPRRGRAQDLVELAEGEHAHKVQAGQRPASERGGRHRGALQHGVQQRDQLLLVRRPAAILDRRRTRVAREAASRQKGGVAPERRVRRRRSRTGSVHSPGWVRGSSSSNARKEGRDVSG